MGYKILTISIAAYNVEKYIEKTLESLIVTNCFDDLEVLVINDGSIDTTSIIAEEYTKKYPNVFKLITKENGGYGSTINTALKIAKGKYFRQLDGDDWFDTKNLEEFIEFLRLSDVDCVYSPYWEIYSNKNERILKSAFYSNESVSVSCIVMHALTYRTAIFKENHILITENCFYTDCEYNIKPLAFVNSIKYFNKPIYCYRLGLDGQSVSREGFTKHYREHNKVTLELMSFYEHNKEQISCLSKSAIEEYILGLYKSNFYIALELSDKTVFENYKQLDLTVKNKFPMFYKRKNLKMTIVVKSRYKLWSVIKIFHSLFEKKYFLK